MIEKGLIFVYQPIIQMTVTVAIRHEKAMQLLQDLADLNLIDTLPPGSSPEPELPEKKLSSFIGQISTGQTTDQLGEQLSQLRHEWNRTI